jgi:tetratricopeptide (TPR) repeat protein
MAAVGLIILTPLSFGWTGVNFWQDIQEWPLFLRVQDDEILIIISQFDGITEQRIDVSRHIVDELSMALKRQDAAYNERLLIKKLHRVITEENEAREVGEAANATLVIWGWLDPESVTANYEFIKDPVQITQKELIPERVDLFLGTELPESIRYLSEFTIGQAHYLADQFYEAFVHFDSALAVLDKLEEELTKDSREIEPLQERWIASAEKYARFFGGVARVREATQFNDVAIAMHYYQIAIERDDQFAEAYNNLGVAFSTLRNHEAAIENFNQAINLDLEVAYYNRGNVHYNQNDFAKAIEDYTQAIGLLDTSSIYLAHYNRGLAYAKSQSHGAAVEDYTQAIELAPEEDPGFYLARAKSYFELCQYEPTLRDLSVVIEEFAAGQDDIVDVLTDRGATYTRLGLYTEALIDYEEALRLNPDYGPAHYNLAATKSLQGNFDVAIDALSKAFTLNPELAKSAACDSDLDSIRNHEKLPELTPPPGGCPPDSCR